MTAGPDRPARRVRMVRGGPLIIDGPVEIDYHGTTLYCDGFKVALCQCGRSRIKPFCDTSHRRLRHR